MAGIGVWFQRKSIHLTIHGKVAGLHALIVEDHVPAAMVPTGSWRELE